MIQHDKLQQSLVVSATVLIVQIVESVLATSSQAGVSAGNRFLYGYQTHGDDVIQASEASLLLTGPLPQRIHGNLLPGHRQLQWFCYNTSVTHPRRHIFLEEINKLLESERMKLIQHSIHLFTTTLVTVLHSMVCHDNCSVKTGVNPCISGE